ncbi:MAG: ATPase, T2SS/T4P/T4SS family [Sulfurovum sp.]|nr:ATPase, T2SS/T4P/T4SS family [Sulfurovum sp.]
MKIDLDQYLCFLIENHGSDLHLKSGSRVHYRKDGDLLSLDTEVCTVEDIENVAKSILSEKDFQTLHETKELDLNYTYDAQSHFRVNFFYHIDGLSIVFRLIPMEILSFEALRLPEILKELADTPRGLILVTGVTGSGKSTTIATMIDRINTTQKKTHHHDRRPYRVHPPR